jgi:AICAR transformylase/IMP cyclohydrolase PurH
MMRALISVFDKTGVVDFARGLAGLGVELFSTGGTEALLRESGVEVRQLQPRGERTGVQQKSAASRLRGCVHMAAVFTDISKTSASRDQKIP